MDLNLIALNNIKVLANFDSDKNFLNCKDKIILESKIKDETFENITELSQIEYALYFSFHQLINTPIREFIEEYSRKDIIKLMNDAIYMVFLTYDKSILYEENVRISKIMNEIEDIVFNLKSNYKENMCYYKVIDTFDYLFTGFKAFHELSIDFNSHISGIKNYNMDDIDSPSDDYSSDGDDELRNDCCNIDAELEDELVENDFKRRKVE